MNNLPEMESSYTPETSTAEKKTSDKLQAITPKERIRELDNQINTNESRKSNITKEAEKTLQEVEALRKKLGLPPRETLPDSVDALENSSVNIENNQERLREERERLIKEEVDKTIKEMVVDLLKLAHSIDREDWASLRKTGRRSDGSTIKIQVFGEISPDTVKNIIDLIDRGLKEPDKILKSLAPDLLEATRLQIEASLTKENEGEQAEPSKESETLNEGEQAEPSKESETLSETPQSTPEITS